MVTFKVTLPDDPELRMNTIANILKDCNCKLILIDNVTKLATFESSVGQQEEATDSQKPTILLD